MATQNELFVPAPYAQEFLNMRTNQKHAVTVCVMDTGVDPGAFGLTNCPDGSVKVVDVIDCTGSDDIIVKSVKSEDVSEYLPTLYNFLHQTEKSELDDSDKTFFDSCEFYTGIRSLRSFVCDRKYKPFETKQKQVIDNTVLKVVVFKNESNALCLVDFDSGKTVLAEYNVDYKYGSIPLGDNLFMNFGFHLYDSDQNTKICSLVFDTGSHATHVAGIIGGCFPDPAMNGINPHCKILSLKIGDSRVNGMETSYALIRALKEIVDRNCHIVNYSYGEGVESVEGRFIDMLKEYTFKHNIVFVTSAGNSGPNFTTIGAPGDTTDRTINIGAYTDAKYLDKLYHVYHNTPSFTKGPYHWSSRGPSAIGCMGVDVLAPGCALTSHPRWYRANLEMCNGTSMASPNAAGFLSLIMSQFEPDNYPHAYWIKRYLEKTCSTVDDVERIGQGHGLIGQTWIDLDFFAPNGVRHDYYYEIVINNDKNKKGIVCYNSKHHTIELKIRPLQNNCKLNESFHRLTSSSTNKDLNNINIVTYVDSRPLTVEIDCSEEYSGYIEFYRNKNDVKSYVCAVPINIFACFDIELNEYKIETLLEPGSIDRTYFIPKCNVLEIDMKSNDNNKIFIAVSQMINGKTYDERCTNATISKSKFIFNIVPNVLTELCLYLPWTSPKTNDVVVEVKGKQKQLELTSRLYELNESIQFNMNDKDFTESSILVRLENIVTKHSPISAEITEFNDNRYVVDGKKLKLLRLEYLNRDIYHQSGSYSLNVGNKVYNSNLCMSGCINGYFQDRHVFYGNYVPKNVNNPVDFVVVEMIDYDENVLKSYAGTILSVSRSPSKYVATSVKPNIINLPLKEINKLENVYDGDYLQFKMLNESFEVLYRKTPIVKIGKQPDNLNSEQILTYMKDFNIVKDFINGVSNNVVFDVKVDRSKSDTIKERAVMFVNYERVDDIDKIKDLLNTDSDERVKLEYLGTLFLTSDREFFLKRIKATHAMLAKNNLLKTVPYNVIDLALNMYSGHAVLHENIEKNLSIVATIESNVKYWSNVCDSDLTVLRSYLINSLENKTRYKRKLDLMLESDEMVNF